jgi:hypothetical protein
MTAILCTVVAHMFPLGVEVDFAPVPVLGRGAPVRRITVVAEATGGRKVRIPMELGGSATQSTMRDMVLTNLRHAGWTAIATSSSALVTTGTRKSPVKSIKVSGDIPTNSPPIARFVPKGR